MIKTRQFMIGALLIALVAPVWALEHFLPAPPKVTASAYLLMDHNSKQVIAQQNPDEEIDPASLTKMMTMYIVDYELKAGRLKLDDTVRISKKAWKMGGSKMFIEAGSDVKVEELIRGIIVQSGNDASIAMAEHIAGSEEAFVSIMNQFATELGMLNTRFANVTGWPAKEHFTTVKDLAKLASALIEDFPESYEIYSEKWFTYKGIKQPNRNRLLWQEDYIDGIKTGHSDSAGYCLATSGKQGKMRLISIIVGSKSDAKRTEDSIKLMRYGFRFYETHQLFSEGDSIKQPRVWLGKNKAVSLGLEKDLYITIPHGQYDQLEAVMNVDKRLEAPITQGALLGKLVVKLEDQLVAERDMIALEPIAKASFFNRLSDYFSLSLHKFIGSTES